MGLPLDVDVFDDDDELVAGGLPVLEFVDVEEFVELVLCEKASVASPTISSPISMTLDAPMNGEDLLLFIGRDTPDFRRDSRCLLLGRIRHSSTDHQGSILVGGALN